MRIFCTKANRAEWLGINGLAAASISFCLALGSGPALAQTPPTRIVTFGDSLSDVATRRPSSDSRQKVKSLSRRPATSTADSLTGPYGQIISRARSRPPSTTHFRQQVEVSIMPLVVLAQMRSVHSTACST
jgi:phospholipase/lecithinase/hemolysin